MDNETYRHFEARAAMMKALAHPTRLFIVDELSKGEKCVRRLTSMIGDDTSTVSKHLSVLKNAGIVGARRDGAWIYYSLKAPCVLNFFTCVEKVIESSIPGKGK